MANEHSFAKVTGLRFFLVFLLFMLAAATAQAQNPVLLINQPLVPDAIKPGSPGFTLTINGTGFYT